MASRRVERVARLLKQTIGRVIVSEISDPRMGFVTIVKVEPSPDLRTARVFVSVMGEPAEATRTLRGLRHAARFIKRRVADEVNLRSVPDLVFVEDQSVKGSARVSKIIADALADSAAAKPAGADLSDEELEQLLVERKDEEDLEEEADEEEEEEEEDKGVENVADAVDGDEDEDEDEEEEQDTP